MIRKTILIQLLFMPFIMSAAYLIDFPLKVKQPDGTVINCYVSGDEFYNWLHDENNFTIVQSQQDGYYYYAGLEDDQLVPSGYKAGETDPFNTDLKPGINISEEKIRKIRQEIEKDTPAFPPGYSSGLSRSEGTMNNIVIYVRFSDQTEFDLDTSLYYNWLNKSEPAYNSLYNYFHEASYEKLDIVSWFYPISENNIILSYQDSHERNYFMPYNQQTNPNGYLNHNDRRAREHALLRDAVQYINSNDPIPQSLDIDFNNDSLVDNVIFVIRGEPAAWSNLLWPHRWSLFSENVWINGKRVWDYNFQIETHLNTSGVGVLCHEMFHTLGAPDLYHYSNNGIMPAGEWDIMQHTLNPPQYMSSYMKYKYGRWIDSIPEITSGGTYCLFPLQNEEKSCYKIRSVNTPDEYFVIEYRKKEGTFESSLPASGLLIYRIDSTAGNGNAEGPPDELYLYRPGGTIINNGNTEKAAFALNYNRNIFNDDTDPACFLQNGDPGGLFISDISQTGDSMSFFVDIPGPPMAALDARVYFDCIGSRVEFYDLSIGIPTQWEWNFEPNTVSFVDGTNQHSENPVVTFQESGFYNVSLSVSNQYDSDEITMQNFIQIGTLNGPFVESFESATFKDISWRTENPDDLITWDFAEVGGSGNGNRAVMIDFRKIFEFGQRDRLISPPFNLEGMNSAYLFFEHAYAQYNQQVADSLIIYISNDCGENWVRIFEEAEDGSGNFATHALMTDYFIPEIEEDWCISGYGSSCSIIDLSAWLNNGPLKLAFESFSMFGNPLYLDNINIGETVGNYEDLETMSVDVFPNPSSGFFTLTGMQIIETTEVKIYNLQGQCIKKSRVISGENNIGFNLQNFPNGLYLITLYTGEEQLVKKVMKQ